MLLLLFIPALKNRNLKSLSWLAYVCTLYLIYAVFQLLTSAHPDFNQIQLDQLFYTRLLAAPMSISLLILFFALNLFVRQEKIKLGLIIPKKH